MRQTFSLKHHRTLTTMHNLASIFKSQGRYEDAELLIKQVLQSQEKHLGSEHVSTVITRYYLASIFTSQGRYDDAEQL
jgi:tetratricopeptide (TPR) repeat protein